jgi:tryptophan synthase beta subunit
MMRFGEFGGRYIPEVLANCHIELANVNKYNKLISSIININL